MRLRAAFTPDNERYEGVRPIQFHLLRLGYVPVVLLVGYRAWMGILSHEGDWGPHGSANRT